MDCGLRSTLPARSTLTPYIRFLFIDSRICLTLPSDLPCGDSPCVIANPSPPSGWVEDLHLLAAEHARHTTEGGESRPLNRQFSYGAAMIPDEGQGLFGSTVRKLL
jgi:hypothetical protein